MTLNGPSCSATKLRDCSARGAKAIGASSGRLTFFLQTIASAECCGLLAAAERVEQRGQVVEASRHVGMLRAEHFLVDRQRALIEWPCPSEVPLIAQQEGKVVEARRHVGMLRAEHFLVNRQGALCQPARRITVPLIP